MSKRIEHRFLQAVKCHQPWLPNQPLTVAVSGGVDSMVLLDLLVKTQRSHQARLQVVTFDHGLREASQQEVVMVKEVCQSYGIPCMIHQLHLEKGPQLQERARMARREILLRCEGWLATAHHASDQAETILFRMLRGSGLDGLQGMHYKQGRWVKPLLGFFKPEIYQYAKDRGLQWVEDPSNTHSTRGTIRELWSTLASIHPNPQKAMSSVGHLLQRDADCLQELTDQQYPTVIQNEHLNVQRWKQCHLAIRSRILRQWLWTQGVSPKLQQIEDLLVWEPQRNGQRYTLNSSISIRQLDGLWSLC